MLDDEPPGRTEVMEEGLFFPFLHRTAMKNTLEIYDDLLHSCAAIFREKLGAYGVSWEGLSRASLIAQVQIKWKRILTVRRKGTQKVEEPLTDGLMAMINYSIIGIIRGDIAVGGSVPKLPREDVAEVYHDTVGEIRSLLEKKNHDYGDAWRDLTTAELSDIITMRMNRMRHKLPPPEGFGVGRIGPSRTHAKSREIREQFMDLINYCVFFHAKMTMEAPQKGEESEQKEGQ